MSIQIPEDKGAKKRKQYWNICITFAIIAFIMLMVGITAEQTSTGEYVTIDGYEYYQCEDDELIMLSGYDIENDGYEDCFDGSDEGEDPGDPFTVCYGFFCCFSMIFGISALSTKNDDRVIVIQQQPRYTPVIQQPVIQQTVIQQASPQTAPNAPDMFAKTKGMWAEKARNLELARNWEGAAEAYEKAGMYSEAGKIRQDHLEKSQPMVQIGHVGDTVLNDSVMISDGSSKTCNNCGNNVEVGWNICPSCSTPL